MEAHKVSFRDTISYKSEFLPLLLSEMLKWEHSLTFLTVGGKNVHSSL
jgi:hypothetical protein